MKATPGMIKIDSRDPDMPRVRELARSCREGKIAIFPTETVYGIGAPMSVPGIEEKLYGIKGRPEHKPFSYHIADWEMLETLKIRQTPLVKALARQFWPGPVTLIVPTEEGQKIGVRFPKCKIALALIREAGEPFVATSANASGKSSPHTAAQAVDQLPGAAELVIDGGKTEMMLDSTVVDASGEVPVVLRKGAHGPEVEKAVEKIKTSGCPRKRILVVCTGNSCRSPMAEGWLRREIEKRGLADKIEVISCGTSSRDGLPCTPEAEFVMRNREIDMSRFRSRFCRKGDLWCSDVILAMAEQHAAHVVEMLPAVKDRTITLNVADPIGMGMSVYEKTLSDIELKMKQHMNKITQLD